MRKNVERHYVYGVCCVSAGINPDGIVLLHKA